MYPCLSILQFCCDTKLILIRLNVHSDAALCSFFKCTTAGKSIFMTCFRPGDPPAKRGHAREPPVQQLICGGLWPVVPARKYLSLSRVRSPSHKQRADGHAQKDYNDSQHSLHRGIEITYKHGEVSPGIKKKRPNLLPASCTEYFATFLCVSKSSDSGDQPFIKGNPNPTYTHSKPCASCILHPLS